jgi:hypothetical protein
MMLGGLFWRAAADIMSKEGGSARRVAEQLKWTCIIFKNCAILRGMSWVSMVAPIISPVVGIAIVEEPQQRLVGITIVETDSSDGKVSVDSSVTP